MRNGTCTSGAGVTLPGRLNSSAAAAGPPLPAASHNDRSRLRRPAMGFDTQPNPTIVARTHGAYAPARTQHTRNDRRRYIGREPASIHITAGHTPRGRNEPRDGAATTDPSVVEMIA